MPWYTLHGTKNKVVERIIGHLFLPFLECSGVFGARQFAYRPKRGLRDALAYNLMAWITLIDSGNKVALYCSDVSGAFDKVSTPRLRMKLLHSGLHAKIVDATCSWLEERRAVVVVDSASSPDIILEDSVYQGTTWGPPLWNFFFADASVPIQDAKFTESTFADDLNAFRGFLTSFDNNHLMNEMTKCQKKLHNWGNANQVTFDPAKEHFLILHPNDGHGDNFKLLGTTFDHKLKMDQGICEIAAQSHIRISTILRCRRFYDTCTLIRFYKSFVLSFIECATPAVYHATNFALSALDRVQIRLLDELGISKELALSNFSLAPLRARRDIAMLGLIHRVILNEAPPVFQEYIYLSSSVNFPRSLRGSKLRHSKQLHDPVNSMSSSIFHRSIFGLIYAYNLFPQHVVDSSSVSIFQSYLQRGLKEAVTRSVVNWDSLFSSSFKHMSVHAYQSLFVKNESRSCSSLSTSVVPLFTPSTNTWW